MVPPVGCLFLHDGSRPESGARVEGPAFRASPLIQVGHRRTLPIVSESQGSKVAKDSVASPNIAAYRVLISRGFRPEEEARKMRAAIGDKIVVRGHRVGEADRDAVILDVEGPDGGPPYRVRWSDDGHEGVFFPGEDASVEHYPASGRPEIAPISESR